MPHPTETITVTELARNLASIIDRVRMSSTRVSITRGTQTVAQLVPAVQPRMTLDGLLKVLQATNLPENERESYAADLKTVRKSATVPPSPWG